MRPTQNNVLLKGTSGCGKTYFLVDWIRTEIIPYSDAKVITNLPLGEVPSNHFKPPKFEGETFLDRIAKRCKVDPDEIHERFELLEESELDKWAKGQGGPWDLPRAGETYMILDEFASYCTKFLSNEVRAKWIEWFAKARHRNVYNICISQTDKKIPRDIVVEFGERWQLSDTASKEIHPFGILEGDINQFISKVLGRDIGATQVIVRIDEGGTISNIANSRPYRVNRSTAGFELYNSFTAQGSNESRRKKWETLNWPQFLRWFAGRNVGFILRIVGCLLVVVLMGYAAYACWNWSSGNGFKKPVAVEKLKEGKTDVPVESDKLAEGRVVGRVGGRSFSVSGNRRGLFDAAASGIDKRSWKDLRDKD